MHVAGLFDPFKRFLRLRACTASRRGALLLEIIRCAGGINDKSQNIVRILLEVRSLSEKAEESAVRESVTPTPSGIPSIKAKGNAVSPLTTKEQDPKQRLNGLYSSWPRRSIAASATP